MIFFVTSVMFVIAIYYLFYLFIDKPYTTKYIGTIRNNNDSEYHDRFEYNHAHTQKWFRKS